MLVILIFGLGLMFGRGKVEDYFKLLIWLIFAPVLLAVGINQVVWLWNGLPFWLQILSILLMPVFVSVILRTLFPKAKWLQGFQETIFLTAVYLVTFPFRFIWRASRFVFQREHRTTLLEPYRPAVGGKPPLKEQGERPKNHSSFL